MGRNFMGFLGIKKVLTISTTTAVTINENADPDVPHDVGLYLRTRRLPIRQPPRPLIAYLLYLIAVPRNE